MRVIYPDNVAVISAGLPPDDTAAAGWTHKWNTIAAANMAAINTIPKAIYC